MCCICVYVVPVLYYFPCIVRFTDTGDYLGFGKVDKAASYWSWCRCRIGEFQQSLSVMGTCLSV